MEFYHALEMLTNTKEKTKSGIYTQHPLHKSQLLKPDQTGAAEQAAALSHFWYPCLNTEWDKWKEEGQGQSYKNWDSVMRKQNTFRHV